MAKKTTTTKSTKSKTSTSAKTRRMPHLYRERHPENHDVSGKYIFFYLFFAACTLIFALTTIYLYNTAQDITRRYEESISQNQKNNKNCTAEIDGTTNE